MKKLLLFILFAPLSAFSQKTDGLSVMFGGIYPAFSLLDVSERPDLGFMAGISTYFGNGDHAFEIDLIYTKFGFSGNDYNYRMAYLAAKPKYRRNLNNWLFASTGPEFAFVGLSELRDYSGSYDESNHTNQFQVGIGGGFKAYLTDMLFIDLNSVIGITKLFTYSDSRVTRINLSIGLEF